MSNDGIAETLAGRSLLLVGGGALAVAVAEAAVAQGMRVVMLRAADDDGHRVAAACATRALTMVGAVDDSTILHAAIATAATPAGLDAVIEIAFTADDGDALLATTPATLPRAANALADTLRLAQAVAPALRANAGTLVCALTPAALGGTTSCGGVHAVIQRARVALIERLALELGGGTSVFGLCVPLPSRLAPPPRDLTMPAYQPEPSAWAADFLRLLAPGSGRPPSGRVVAAGGPTVIDGLVTLAGN